MYIFVISILFFQIIQRSESSSVAPNPGINQAPQIYLNAFEYTPKGWAARPTYVDVTKESSQSNSDYQNDFYSKIGTDYVITAKTNKAVFTCEASYPITWKFPFPKQLTTATDYDFQNFEYRISNFSQISLQPMNTRFKLSMCIKFSHAKFLSVNVSCVSVEQNAAKQTSIHVFHAGKSGLEHQNETVNITVDPSKLTTLSSITLPCRPSSPKLKIVLEKSLNGNWTRISTGNVLSFDPKHGFVFLGNKTLGLYKCFVMVAHQNGSENVSKEQFVLLNVTSRVPGKPVSATYFEPRSNLKGTASVNQAISKTSLKYHIHPGPLVVCCSGVQGKPPMLFMSQCETRLSCGINKGVLLDEISTEGGWTNSIPFVQLFDPKGNTNDTNSDCSKTVLYGESDLIVCKGETVDYAEHFVQIFHSRLAGPVANRSNDIQGVDRPQGITSLSKYETANVADSANQSQKMALIIGEYFWRKNLSQAVADDSFPLLLTQYQDPLRDVLKDNLEFGKMESDIGWRRLGRSVKEYDRDFYYQGESLILACFGVSFYYAHGAQLRLNWKTGTGTILNTNELGAPFLWTNVYLSGNGVMVNGWGNGILPYFGVPVVADREMSSVDCWMPARNSDRWDKISKSLPVLPSVAPKFAEETEETVTFSLGNAGNVITCTVADGLPAPVIKLTRDGKQVKLDYRVHCKGDKHLMKLSMNFSNVTMAHQGIWQCIAENVKGNATRTINVIVEGDSSADYNIQYV